jgi:ABC-2 type transport system ATP-binding protein
MDAHDATAAIRTQGLTKTYGSRLGIADLDLEVSQGEVFGFIGPNGAGKTTPSCCCWACSVPARTRDGLGSGRPARQCRVRLK